MKSKTFSEVNDVIEGVDFNYDLLQLLGYMSNLVDANEVFPEEHVLALHQRMIDLYGNVKVKEKQKKEYNEVCNIAADRFTEILELRKANSDLASAAIVNPQVEHNHIPDLTKMVLKPIERDAKQGQEILALTKDKDWYLVYYEEGEWVGSANEDSLGDWFDAEFYVELPSTEGLLCGK